MSVRVLVVLGFIFSLALPRCTCLPPLLDGGSESEDETVVDGEAKVSGGDTNKTQRSTSISVTAAGGSIASPNYRMELSVGKTTQGSSPGFQLRPSTVGDK